MDGFVACAVCTGARGGRSRLIPAQLMDTHRLHDFRVHGRMSKFRSWQKLQRAIQRRRELRRLELVRKNNSFFVRLRKFARRLASMIVSW